ncbi:MAG: right-handed parallel beta-helix repeat-containing protein [Gemmataceae bacterium]
MRRKLSRTDVRCSKQRGLAWFRPNVECLEDRLALAVYTVINVLDEGPGSLRQAILNANDNPGADEISFNIPGGGVKTIRPLTALPAITDSLLINGYSQPGSSANNNALNLGSGALGSNAVLNIELDGSAIAAGSFPDGLFLGEGAANSEVRGLVINRFERGIRIFADGVIVAGCFIGTNATGTSALGNNTGITISSDYAEGVRIGGQAPADRNVIAGNSGRGIFAGGTGHIIQGNFIGTDVSGTLDLGNGDNGLYVTRSTSTGVIGNLVSGNSREGVLTTFAQDVRIENNFIGTDRTGSIAIPNQGFGGVVIRGDDNPPSWVTFSSAQIIGNVISGNTGYGIHAFQNVGTTARPHQLTISANRIGVADDNVTSLGNSSIGIYASSPFIDQATLDISDNHIANNAFGGIYLTTAQPSARIQRNLLYSNGTAVNLDIGTQGAGGSGIWPAPSITAASINGTSLNFTGTLAGSPNTFYTIDFFASPTQLMSGQRTARAYIASFGITTNAVGQATLSSSLPGGLQLVGQYLTTTATAAGTSELSAPVVITSATGSPVVYTVTNTLDSGAGSLRQAILDANANAGADLIRFNIASSGVKTIRPLTALPSITGPVSIDGYTQPGSNPNTNPLALGSGARGSNAVIRIEIDGSLQTSGSGILSLSSGSDASVIRGLAINRSRGYGIRIFSDSAVIEGNFIGTDPTGMIARPNVGDGVVVPDAELATAASARIGGTSPANRNVISASNNGISGYGSNHQIYGNLIGTDASGTVDLGNSLSGVTLQLGSNLLIGLGGVGNLISGNDETGLSLEMVQNAFVRGNLIGTDITGTLALGNLHGVGFYADTSIDWSIGTSATIGGPSSYDRNIISGNLQHGITLGGGGAARSPLVVQNNWIGRGFSPLPLGNGSHGVFFDGSAVPSTSIDASFTNNEIANNGSAGIRLATLGTSTFTTQNNSIFNNGGLGIDVGTAGPTLTSVPTLSLATFDASSITINGSLQGVPNTTYEIEFFASTNVDASGYGEGRWPLGRQSVTTNASGSVSFAVTMSLPPWVLGPVYNISATSLISGGVVSEFAQTITAIPASENATTTSTQLRDGVNALFGSLPDWGQSFNVGFQLPVVSSALNSLFAAQQAITQHVQAFAVNVTGYYAQLRSQLEAIPGITVRHCSAEQGIELVYARNLDLNLQASGNTYNDATPEVLRSLAQSLSLDGNFTLSADLSFSLAFGVDDSGFYLLPESELTLQVTGNGSITGNGNITSDTGTVMGSGSANLSVTLSPSEATAKYRTSSFASAASWLQASASGTAGLDLAVDLGRFDFAWSGDWNVTTTSQVNVTLDTPKLDATFALPGLRSASGSDALFTLQGSYVSNLWTLNGSGTDYRLAGFTVDTLQLSVQTSPSTFNLTGNLAISTALADEEPLEFTATVTMSDRDHLQIDAILTIDAYLGSNPLLLWIDNGEFTFDFDANLETGDFTGKVDMIATQAVFLPRERRTDGGTPDGPLTLTGVSGSLNSAGTLHLVIDTIVGELDEGSNAVRLIASDAVLDLGPDQPNVDEEIFHITELALQFPFLGRELTLTGTDLRYTRGEGLTVDSLRVEAEQDLIAVGGLVPFSITSLEVNGNNNEPIQVDSFAVTVVGTIDLSIFDALPGTPIFRIGEQEIAGPAQPVNLTVQVVDGRASLQRTGPITVGFADLAIGPLIAGATLTLGQIVNGQLDTSHQAFTLDLESSGVNLEFDVEIVTSNGRTTLSAAGTVTFPEIAPEGMPFIFTNMQLSADLDLVLNSSLQVVGTPSLTFTSGLIGKTTLEVNDWVHFEARQTRFNFQAGPEDVFVTFGELSLEFDEGFELLDGWGGEAGGFGVTTAGELVLFDNAFARVRVPDFDDLQWPAWLPLRFDKLGFKFGDQSVLGNRDDFLGAPDPLELPQAILSELRDFSIIVSGGFVSNGLWPIDASVEDLEINLPRLIDYARGVPGTPIPFRLPSGSIGVGPFELGKEFSVEGSLRFGTVTHQGREELYVIVVGGFQYKEIGADITLAISSVGPVVAAVQVPLAFPLGPTGFLLSGARGAIIFGQEIPDVDEPTELIDPKNDERFANPFDQMQGNLDGFVRGLVLEAMVDGKFTWEDTFTLLLSGSFTHAAAVGMVSGDLTLGTNVAWSTSTTASAGLKMLGFGNVAAAGIPLGEVRAVLDFTRPLEPDLDFAFSTTTSSNPLSYLLPANASFVVGVDTKGLVPGLLMGLRTFVQRVSQGTLTVAEQFFSAALDRVADLVRQQSTGRLIEVLYPTGKALLDEVEFRSNFRSRLLSTISESFAALNANETQLLRLARMGQELIQKLLDEFHREMPAQPEQFFAGLTSEFGDTVRDLLRDGERAVLAFAEITRDGLRQAAGAAVDQFDPAVIISGAIRPQLFGIPLGQPTAAADLRFSKAGLFVSFEVDASRLTLLPSLNTAALLVPLPYSNRTRFDMQFPLGNTFRELAQGNLPELRADSSNWIVGMSMTNSTLLGFDTQLSGLLFPRYNRNLLLQRVQIVDTNGDGVRDGNYDPTKLQVPNNQFFQRLVDNGGFLLDGALRLPRLLTDPFELIESLDGFLPDPAKNPLGFFEALTRLPDALGQLDEVGQLQLFIPDLFQPGLQGAGLTNRINSAYLEGFLNGKLMGLTVGQGRISADTRQFKLTGRVDALGLNAEFRVDRRNNGLFPRLMTEVGLNSMQMRELLVKLGLPSTLLTEVVSSSSRLRVFSPGFDTSASAEALKKTGGIQFSGQLAIKDLSPRTTFNFQVTPPTAGLIPDFTGTASVAGLSLPGLPSSGYVTGKGFSLALRKVGSTVSADLVGTIALFGKDFRARGSLILASDGWAGTLAITTLDGIETTLGNGFTLRGEVVLGINTRSSPVNLNIGGQTVSMARGSRFFVDGLLSLQGFLLEGQFDFSATSTAVTLFANARMETREFGSFTAMGSLVRNSTGLLGFLDLTPDRLGNPLWEVDGTFRLEVNTTTALAPVVRGVTVEKGIAIQVNNLNLRLKPLGDMFRLTGTGRIAYEAGGTGPSDDLFVLEVPKDSPLKLELFKNSGIPGFPGFTARFHGTVRSDGFINLTAGLDVDVQLGDLGLDGSADFTLRRELNGNIRFGTNFEVSATWKGKKAASASVGLSPEGLLSARVRVDTPIFDAKAAVFFNLNNGTWSFEEAQVRPPALPAPPHIARVNVSALAVGGTQRRFSENGQEVLEITLPEGSAVSSPASVILYLNLRGNLASTDQVEIALATPHLTSDIIRLERARAIRDLDFTTSGEIIRLDNRLAALKSRAFTLVSDRDFELTETFDIELSVADAAGVAEENVVIEVPRVRVRIVNDDVAQPANALAFYSFNTLTSPVFNASQIASVSELIHNRRNVTLGGLPDAKGKVTGARGSDQWVADSKGAPYFHFTLNLKAVPNTPYFALPDITGLSFWSQGSTGMERWELRWSEDGFASVLASDDIPFWLTREHTTISRPGRITTSSSVTFRLVGIGTASPGIGLTWWIDNVALLGAPLPDTLESGGSGDDTVGKTIASATPLGPVGPTQLFFDESVQTSQDVDLYAVTVGANQRVTFDIDTPTNSNKSVNAHLRLFDATGKILANNNYRLAPGDAVPAGMLSRGEGGRNGFDPYLEYTFPTAGTYYLGVSNGYHTTYNVVTGAAGTVSSTSGLTGTYRLVVTDFSRHDDLLGSKFEVATTAQTHFGDTIQVRSQIRNAGAKNSPGFGVRWYLSRDQVFSANDDIPLVRTVGGGFQHNHVSIPANSLGAEFTTTLRLPARADLPNTWYGPGYYLLQVIDQANVVAEVNESNNSGLGFTRDTAPVVVTGSDLNGRLRANFSPSRDWIDVSLTRQNGQPIQFDRMTWLVIHGRADDSGVNEAEESSFEKLAAVLSARRPNDQVLLLDWSEGSKDNHPSDIGLDGAGWIPFVGTWVKEVLKQLGIESSQLGLIGHSWGSYVAYEIAKQVDGKSERIVALDPATAAMPDRYPFWEVDFGKESAHAWAFYGDGLYGSGLLASTADAAFKFDYERDLDDWDRPDDDWLHRHAAPIHTFITLLENLGTSSRVRHFNLDRLLGSPSDNPWKLDKYIGTLVPLVWSNPFEGVFVLKDLDRDNMFGETLDEIRLIRFVQTSNNKELRL